MSIFAKLKTQIFEIMNRRWDDTDMIFLTKNIKDLETVTQAFRKEYERRLKEKHNNKA